MKRFTETTKWRDPWYRRLSPEAKLLWGYLTDNCDSIGLMHLDMEAATFDIGRRMKEEHLAELDSRIQRLEDGKIFIPKFIQFQYGSLSATCPAHKNTIKAVERHGLALTSVGYLYPYNTLTVGIQIPTGKERNGKEKDQDQVGGTGEGAKPDCYSPECRVALYHLNEKSGRAFRETETNLDFIQARLKEPGVTIEGVRRMIDRQVARWKGTDQAEYLRPETLFNKTKFDGYYAARELPVAANDSKPRSISDERNKNILDGGGELSTEQIVAAREARRRLAADGQAATPHVLAGQVAAPGGVEPKGPGNG